MKTILILSLMFLASCGPINQMCEHNEDGLGVACRDVFGYDYEQKVLINKHSNEIEYLKDQVNQINRQIYYLKSQGNALSYEIYQHSTQIGNLQDQISNLEENNEDYQDDIVSLQSSITMLNLAITENQIDISNLESTINLNIVNLADLQLTINNSLLITEVLDPCGDNASKIDEIFLRMSNGMIISSFSDNGSALTTRFSVIPTSDTKIYSTTDGTSCSFKVFSTGPKADKVCWGSGYNTCI